MKTIKTDCLVIGSGIAGSLYAYIAAANGLKCVLLSASSLEDSNSNLAQGGIVYEPKKDFSDLIKDIQKAGCNICNEEIVKIMCKNGFEAIEKYFTKTFNTDFNRDEKGNLLFTKEAAHSKKRIIYSNDSTGRAIIAAMQKALKKQKNITVNK